VTIAPEVWTATLAALDGAPRVALSCHEGPDGDALGSMLALGLALRARGVEVVASWSEPFILPRHYAFLPGLDMAVAPSQFPAEPDLAIAFDAGSFNRFGSLEPNLRAARKLVVVDHHASSDHCGHVNVIDADTAASAVLVYELIQRLGVEIDRDIATCLYTGVVTDTGRFQYRNTTPDLHRMVADLLGRGVEHDAVSRAIYETHPVGYLKLAGVALDRLSVRGDAGLVWTWVTLRDLEDHGIQIEDIEALIDLVRSVDVADVAVLMKEQSDGRYKVSMRSKGESNVGAVCESFGGGGHPLAAGFTSPNGDRASTIDRIVAALSR